MRGLANDAAQKEALLATLRALFPTATIDDQLQIAALDGAIDFEAATRLALAALAKLGGGTIAIADGKLTVNGSVAGAASRRDLATLLSPSALPPPWPWRRIQRPCRCAPTSSRSSGTVRACD